MFYLYDMPLAIGQSGTVIDKTTGSTATPPPASANAGNGAEEQASGGFWAEWGSIIIIYAALFAVMYFFWMRPQNKKRKQAMEMQTAIKVGDSVITSNGMYGTIASLGDECCLVEFGTNKSIKIPIRRADIVGIKEPVFTSSEE